LVERGWGRSLMEFKAALTKFLATECNCPQTKLDGVVASKDFPITRSEDWRYLNLNGLASDLPLCIPNSTVDLTSLQSYLICQNYLVIVDGCYRAELSNFGIAEVKLSLTENQAAIDQTGSENGFLSSLNQLAGNQTLQISVAEKNSATACLQILFVSTDSPGRSFSAPSVKIILGQGAKLEVLESYVNLAKSSFVTPNCQYQVAENANLTVNKIVNLEGDAFHLSEQKAIVQAGGQFNSRVFNFRGKLIRNNLSAVLAGTGAYASMLGLSLPTDNDQVDNHTVLDHAAPNCNSLEIYQGIYDRQSRGIFDGTIIVRPDAQKTNAIQTNRAVLLSREAVSYAKPQLKIWADDVKCTHGATCGELDDQALFYLRSRGIPVGEAKKILLNAFAAEVIGAIQVPELQTYLTNEINDQLFK
jgi:Fe-S cluster assembly protein SufD